MSCRCHHRHSSTVTEGNHEANQARVRITSRADLTHLIQRGTNSVLSSRKLRERCGALDLARESVGVVTKWAANYLISPALKNGARDA